LAGLYPGVGGILQTVQPGRTLPIIASSEQLSALGFTDVDMG